MRPHFDSLGLRVSLIQVSVRAREQMQNPRMWTYFEEQMRSPVIDDLLARMSDENEVQA